MLPICLGDLSVGLVELVVIEGGLEFQIASGLGGIEVRRTIYQRILRVLVVYVLVELGLPFNLGLRLGGLKRILLLVQVEGNVNFIGRVLFRSADCAASLLQQRRNRWTVEVGILILQVSHR